MKIEVTREDIERGVRKDGFRCPIARALKRSFPEAKISVTSTYIDIDNNSWLTPKDIYMFIMDFDYHRPVKPFSFDLEQLKKSLL